MQPVIGVGVHQILIIARILSNVLSKSRHWFTVEYCSYGCAFVCVIQDPLNFMHAGSLQLCVLGYTTLEHFLLQMTENGEAAGKDSSCESCVLLFPSCKPEDRAPVLVIRASSMMKCFATPVSRGRSVLAGHVPLTGYNPVTNGKIRFHGSYASA